MVIPHKDFVELNKPMEQYFRIFIPLEDVGEGGQVV